MPETSTIVAFSIAALVLFIVPGPAVLYIVTRSVVGGRGDGMVSVAGIHLGSLVHIAAAVAGLSALLATSATAFRLVKWAGAVYLIYLGIRAIRDRGSDDPATSAPARMTREKVFWQGFVVNLLNPKTAVFFLAFVRNHASSGEPPTGATAKPESKPNSKSWLSIRWRSPRKQCPI